MLFFFLHCINDHQSSTAFICTYIYTASTDDTPIVYEMVIHIFFLINKFYILNTFIIIIFRIMILRIKFYFLMPYTMDLVHWTIMWYVHCIQCYIIFIWYNYMFFYGLGVLLSFLAQLFNIFFFVCSKMV